MRRYESPAENWPRAFRIVQTCSSEYYFLFKYIRIPIFQIKLKILSLSLLWSKINDRSQQFVSYWRNFHSNLNERLILLNYTACWNIEKRKKERKKVIPKHFSKCSLLSPFPSLVDDVFGQPRVIFARRDGCSNRAHRSRHESSPVHYGRSGGNSTGMRHREYPAARNLFHSRARIGRPRIPPRDGERIASRQ